jgi:hypothetical protein
MELTLTNLFKAGESGLGYAKFMGTPLGIARTLCGLASHLPATAVLSERVNKRVDFFTGPSEMAALALDAFALVRCCWVTEKQPQMNEWGLSIVKKGCDTLRWLDKFHFIEVASSCVRQVEGMGLLTDLMSSSLQLREEKDFVISIPRFLKASLLIFVYLTDDKRVKIVATVFGVVADGYSFYKRARTFSFDFRTLNIAPFQVCQIITSIALACIAYYLLEIRILSKTLD